MGIGTQSRQWNKCRQARGPKTQRSLRVARKHHVLNTPWLSLSPAGRAHLFPPFSPSLPLTKDFFRFSRCLGLFFRLGLCLRVRHGGTDGKWVVLWVNPPSLMFSYTRLLLFQPARHEGAAKTPQARADWSVSAHTPCLPAFDWLAGSSFPKRSSYWSTEKLVLSSLWLLRDSDFLKFFDWENYRSWECLKDIVMCECEKQYYPQVCFFNGTREAILLLGTYKDRISFVFFFFHTLILTHKLYGILSIGVCRVYE